MSDQDHPPICDYEGSDYQDVFWNTGSRAYEDKAEAIALEHLLDRGGKLMLEVGAGAGRNTKRYGGYERVVLLDYSVTQLEQARARLGSSDRYLYVAADIYKLPFVSGLFDGATMIRVLHHMADGPQALAQIRRVMQPDSLFILEFANKKNLKAIVRHMIGKQAWSPFGPDPVEFVELNFNFHPKTTLSWLVECGFKPLQQRTVSHFRIPVLKDRLPVNLLVGLDRLLQPTGKWFQYSPSIFVSNQATSGTAIAAEGDFFQCPNCQHSPLEALSDGMACSDCGAVWPLENGIYNFKASR
jgi:ubiquinone/menaquinone biosynthesis C-methylase UbiE